MSNHGEINMKLENSSSQSTADDDNKTSDEISSDFTTMTTTTEPQPGVMNAPPQDSSDSNDDEQLHDIALDPTSTAAATTPSANFRPPLNPCWTRITDKIIHDSVPAAVTVIALVATKRPRVTLSVLAALALALCIVGYQTNFILDVDQFEAFAPFGVRPREHKDWIEASSEFPPTDILLAQIVHQSGDNVVSIEGVRRVFDAYDVVVQTPGYHELCAQSDYTYNGNKTTCQVSSVIRFWNYNRTDFEATVTSNDDVMAVVSQSVYPDGTPVDTGAIMGNPHVVDNNTITAQSFTTAFLFPDIEDETTQFEEAALESNFPLQNEWRSSDSPYQLEVQSEISYALEFMRAIEKDLPLIPMVFLIMTLFTCTIFFRRHAVQSRLLLGVGAVITIVCSILSGYGLMFLCGVPFTNMTQLVPFVVFGVGLDDTFIITGAFARTNPHQSMEQRVQQTMKDVGVSISVTTLTTAVAFGLGSVSDIPAVRWLCLYSMVTIIIDFLYQITFFMALLVLDAQRIQQNRRDCCVCFTVQNNSDMTTTTTTTRSNKPEDAPQLEQQHTQTTTTKPTFIDRIMIWYADALLANTWIKGMVLIAFTVLFGLCAYSATNMGQEFQITELVPSGSYVISFLDAFETYSARSLPIYAYFRNVNQADATTQQDMITYVEELSDLEQFGTPRFCWVRDFQTLLQQEEQTNHLGLALEDLTFQEQLQVLLSHPTVKEVYGDDIVLDEQGNIVASRCLFFAENLSMDVVDDQVDLLRAQEEVSAAQPVNQDRSDWAFFSHDDFYLTWEFYDVVVQEFIVTAIVGVVAVTVIGFLCIPHWTASLFVLPMIGVLYVDLVGVLQAAGLHINVVTHVALAMSIGLLVDYIVHILLRYFESSTATNREERVKETLRTMGAAVLSGGLSTLLGVLPLAFSTSEVMRTVFIAFLAMVLLGCSHGLILLPVLLSIVGPETTPAADSVVAMKADKKTQSPTNEAAEELPVTTELQI